MFFFYIFILMLWGLEPRNQRWRLWMINNTAKYDYACNIYYPLYPSMSKSKYFWKTRSNHGCLWLGFAARIPFYFGFHTVYFDTVSHVMENLRMPNVNILVAYFWVLKVKYSWLCMWQASIESPRCMHANVESLIYTLLKIFDVSQN